MNEHYQQWRKLAPLGLLTIGAGASILGEATIKKGNQRPFWQWFIIGTLGLVCLNSGISRGLRFGLFNVYCEQKNGKW